MCCYLRLICYFSKIYSSSEIWILPTTQRLHRASTLILKTFYDRSFDDVMTKQLWRCNYVTDFVRMKENTRCSKAWYEFCTVFKITSGEIRNQPPFCFGCCITLPRQRVTTPRYCIPLPGQRVTTQGCCIPLPGQPRCCTSFAEISVLHRICKLSCDYVSSNHDILNKNEVW